MSTYFERPPAPFFFFCPVLQRVEAKHCPGRGRKVRVRMAWSMKRRVHTREHGAASHLPAPVWHHWNARRKGMRDGEDGGRFGATERSCFDIQAARRRGADSRSTQCW